MTLADKLKRRANKFQDPITLPDVIKYLQKHADLGMSNALIIHPISERKRINRLHKDLGKLGVSSKVYQYNIDELSLEVDIT
jgi:hypothetical protein